MNIAKIKIILITIVVGATTIITALYLSLPILTISTDPQGSKIFINDKYYSESPHKLRLKKDFYQIKITHEEHVDYVETINLNKNYDLSVTLKPKKSANIVDTPISHAVTLSSSGTQNDNLLSIDRNTSELIMINDKNTTVVHSEPVSTFDYIHPIIALVERDNPNSIIFINIETDEKKRIIPDGEILITNLSMSPTSNDVFILGNINAIKRTSGLYRVKNSGEGTSKITDTKATSIKTLSEKLLVEFAYADYKDSSITSIVDTFSKKSIFSTPSNSFSVSPNNEMVAAFSSEKITIFSLKTQTSTEYKITRPYLAEWLNPKTILVFSNGQSGVEFSLFDTETNINTDFKKIAYLSGIYVKSINGITKSNIYLTSNDGTLYNLSRLSVEASH